MNFFNDYEKVNPKPETPGAGAKQPSNSVQALTVEDMKTYFDQMKADLIKELKSSTQSGEDTNTKELITGFGTIQISDKPIKEGGNENAGKSDLFDSKHDSE